MEKLSGWQKSNRMRMKKGEDNKAKKGEEWWKRTDGILYE